MVRLRDSEILQTVCHLATDFRIKSCFIEMPFRPSEKADMTLQTACLCKTKHLMLVYFTRWHTVSTILPLCIASSESSFCTCSMTSCGIFSGLS